MQQDSNQGLSVSVTPDSDEEVVFVVRIPTHERYDFEKALRQAIFSILEDGKDSADDVSAAYTQSTPPTVSFTIEVTADVDDVEKVLREALYEILPFEGDADEDVSARYERSTSQEPVIFTITIERYLIGDFKDEFDRRADEVFDGAEDGAELPYTINYPPEGPTEPEPTTSGSTMTAEEVMKLPPTPNSGMLPIGDRD